MTSNPIINGQKMAEDLIIKSKEILDKSKIKPSLKIILVGTDPSSVLFVRKKQEMAKVLGIEVEIKRFKNQVSQNEIIKTLKNWQKNPANGVMIQLPLPKELDRDKIIAEILPGSDVDGLRYCAGLKSRFIPPVVLAIERSLIEAKVDFESETVTIVGRGFLVGWPLLQYLTEKYQVNIKIIERKDLLTEPEILQESSIIIGAANEADFIKQAMIPYKSILIDAGCFKKGRKIVGNFNRRAYQRAKKYTPTPGGIGPLTVAYLFSNLSKIKNDSSK